MKGQAKKLKRQAIQNELLKNFEGDFYQEKKVGEEWYVKMFNGGTKKWQVAVFSQKSFNAYKAFKGATKQQKELDTKFKEEIVFERPTLENVKKLLLNETKKLNYKSL